MIIAESLTIGIKHFTRRYSDKNVYLLQNETGVEYAEAVDVEGVNYTYSETEKPIEITEDELTVDDTLGMLNELGVDVNDQ